MKKITCQDNIPICFSTYSYGKNGEIIETISGEIYEVICICGKCMDGGKDE